MQKMPTAKKISIGMYGLIFQTESARASTVLLFLLVYLSNAKLRTEGWNISKSKPGTVVHICNPSTQKAEARGLQV
jgi:hypothetical protein